MIISQRPICNSSRTLHRANHLPSDLGAAVEDLASPRESVPNNPQPLAGQLAARLAIGIVHRDIAGFMVLAEQSQGGIGQGDCRQDITSLD